METTGRAWIREAKCKRLIHDCIKSWIAARWSKWLHVAFMKRIKLYFCSTLQLWFAPCSLTIEGISVKLTNLTNSCSSLLEDKMRSKAQSLSSLATRANFTASVMSRHNQVPGREKNYSTTKWRLNQVKRASKRYAGQTNICAIILTTQFAFNLLETVPSVLILSSAVTTSAGKTQNSLAKFTMLN